MESGEKAEDAPSLLVNGTPEEAVAAFARMMTVTEATLERRAQLEHALQSRVAIEQAKGIIAERHGLDLEQAFQVLRRAARTNRMKLRDLVATVRPNEATPREIASLLRDHAAAGIESQPRGKD